MDKNTLELGGEGKLRRRGEKVDLVAGFAFCADGRGHNTMQLDFSDVQPEMIQGG